MQDLDYRYFFPEVLQVVPDDDYGLYIYFNDGSVRFHSMKGMLKQGTVFEPLIDKDTFKNKLTIINYTVAWDLKGNRDPGECIDLDPLVLFKESPIVKDPLE